MILKSTKMYNYFRYRLQLFIICLYKIHLQQVLKIVIENSKRTNLVVITETGKDQKHAKYCYAAFILFQRSFHFAKVKTYWSHNEKVTNL